MIARASAQPDVHLGDIQAQPSTSACMRILTSATNMHNAQGVFLGKSYPVWTFVLNKKSSPHLTSPHLHSRYLVGILKTRSARFGPWGGDWLCQHCGFNNFARRTTCFSCGALGGAAAAAQGAPPAAAEDPDGAGSPDVDATTKVLLGHIPSDLSELRLSEYFSEYGPVVNVEIHRTDSPWHFGFVTFATPDAADAVLQNGTHEIDGKSIIVEPHEDAGAPPQKRPKRERDQL